MALTDEKDRTTQGVVEEQTTTETPNAGSTSVSQSDSESSGNSSEVTTKTKTVTVAPPEKMATGQTPFLDFIDQITPKGKSPEELKKEQKRYRTRQIINALSEGLSSAANIYFTSKGAPNMYKAQGNSLDRTKKSYEKMLDDNDAKEQNRVKLLLDAMKADADADKVARAFNLSVDEFTSKEKQRQSQEAREAEKEKREQEQHPEKVRKAKADADKAEADARAAGTRADKEGDLVDAQIDYYRRRGSSSSGGGGAEKYYGRFEGVDYKTKADYDNAVMAAVLLYNERHLEDAIPLTEELVSEKSYSGEPKKVRTVNRDASALAAEYEQRTSGESGSESSGQSNPTSPKKPNPMS